jgi:two-component sensor histidine kinase/CheY-like chemotaxis protein
MTAADGPARLLYIDDDEAFVRLAARALGREGIAVTHARDGDAGLAALDADRFDAVALDHLMPGRSGPSTLSAIVARPGAPPVVYVTGSEEGRVAVAALKAGAADYVLKDASPSFFPLLAQALRQAVTVAEARRERERAQAEVAVARDRAEMLLRECYHRVANSLALVSSMAQMQAAALDDGPGREALQGFQRRVAAIAQVHRRLYTSDDVSHVSLELYLDGLVDELRRSLAQDASTVSAIRLSAEPVTVPTDNAVSLGVMLSELVTNACKYAYPDGRTGEVRVTLRRVDGDQAELLVEDDGAGMGSEASGTGTGHRVLRALARGLRATLDHPPGSGGTRVRVLFPVATSQG